jgi:glyoxylase-like metal-dependent hydrolase (beta-lactamase superfamily II)
MSYLNILCCLCLFCGLVAAKPVSAAVSRQARAQAAGRALVGAPDTYLIEGKATPNGQPDGNSIAIVAPKGLIVFDTGRHEEHTQQILDFARTHDRPIAAIINSHWHLDHVGGNPQLRAAYPDIPVYASSAIDDARKGFLADYRAHLVSEIAQSSKEPQAQKSMRAEIALIDQGAELDPTIVITKSTALNIAGRHLEFHLETHAVTAGDVWVLDPETHVLLAGDLVTLPAPFFESACPSGWRSALAHLASVRFEWLVPGHGTPMRRRAFDTYRKAFSNLLACAAGDATKNTCIDGWITDATELIGSDDVSYARTLIGYYVTDYLRHPTERIQKFCTG